MHSPPREPSKPIVSTLGAGGGVEQTPFPLLLLIGIVAYLISFFLSGVKPAPIELDPSWQVVLEYGFQHALQSGVDLVFTYGPYGWLNCEWGTGGLVVARTCFALIWGGVATWGVLRLFCQLPKPLRYIFIFYVVLACRFAFLEQYLLLICLSIFLCLTDSRRSDLLSLVLTVFSGVVSLIKFNFFLGVAILFVALAVTHTLQGRVKRLVQDLSLWFLSILVFWLLGGQHLSSFLPWVVNSLSITAGYSAMSVVVKKVVAFIKPLFLSPTPSGHGVISAD